MDNGREDKNPWEKWFWSDWASDSGLRACGIPSKGLWIEMLGLMAKSKKKGYLLDGESKMESKTLAKIVGEDITLVDTWLAELKSHGVYSETPDGLIFNRRMARGTKLSEIRAEAGKRGGRPKSKTKANEKANEKQVSASAYASASSVPKEERREEGVTKGEEQPNPDDLRLVQLLIDLIQKNNPKSRVANLSENAQKTWLDQCRLLREMDGRSPTEIEQVIRWSQEDSFWKVNVLSMPTLRKQFDRLWLKSAAPGGAKATGAAEWGRRQGLFNEEK